MQPSSLRKGLHGRAAVLPQQAPHCAGSACQPQQGIGEEALLHHRMHIRHAVKQNCAFTKPGGERPSADVAVVVLRAGDQDFDLRSTWKRSPCNSSTIRSRCDRRLGKASAGWEGIAEVPAVKEALV